MAISSTDLISNVASIISGKSLEETLKITKAIDSIMSTFKTADMNTTQLGIALQIIADEALSNSSDGLFSDTTLVVNKIVAAIGLNNLGKTASFVKTIEQINSVSLSGESQSVTPVSTYGNGSGLTATSSTSASVAVPITPAGAGQTVIYNTSPDPYEYDYESIRQGGE